LKHGPITGATYQNRIQTVPSYRSLHSASRHSADRARCAALVPVPCVFGNEPIEGQTWLRRPWSRP